MKKQEILRVARICLPKLHSDRSNLLDESDLQVSTICSLWSGMGHIYKVSCLTPSVTFVVKHVAAPRKQQSFGDRRKAASYQVEANFYDHLAPRLIEKGLTLPQPLLVERDCGKSKNEIVICMFFVESTSYSGSDADSTKAVVTWLATLHAAYWGAEAVDKIVKEVGLQATGSYWHLDTRPDEHESMPSKGWEGRLKKAARAIDSRLKRDPIQCIIHGDAKDANVLYSTSGQVTLCDFQYCGKGVPTSDLAYFFCSSVSPDDEDEILQFYLDQLTERLADGIQAPSLQELQDLMELSYCDFYRFMSGWGFWGSGAEDRVKRVLHRLDGGTNLGSEEAYDIAIRREYG